MVWPLVGIRRLVHHVLNRGNYRANSHPSLVVGTGGLRPLCLYIHLNRVRAYLCPVDSLSAQRWNSTAKPTP